MKHIKWKILLLTSLVTLAPILFGIALYKSLPAEIAIHFDMYGNPDGFASKNFSVFGIPFLMVVLQVICCMINDTKAAQYGERKKLELATKWIIPGMSIVLQTATLGFALGWAFDIQKVAALLVGLIFLLIGNYLPKFGENKKTDEDMEKTLRINRMIGRASILMGILFIASAFLPPSATVICICLLIPYAVFCIAYGIKIGRK